MISEASRILLQVSDNFRAKTQSFTDFHLQTALNKQIFFLSDSKLAKIYSWDKVEIVKDSFVK
jgi:hypothetical protein